MYHVFSLHFSINRHQGCLHPLAIVKSAAIDMGVQVSLKYADLKSFWVRTKEWYSWDMVVILLALGKRHADFNSGGTSSHCQLHILTSICCHSFSQSSFNAFPWGPRNTSSAFISHVYSFFLEHAVLSPLIDSLLLGDYMGCSGLLLPFSWLLSVCLVWGICLLLS